MTLLENFFAKNAEKIKAFIDNGAKNGSNKFVRFLAVTAGLVMSILSVVGATTIFKDNVKSDDAEKSVADLVVTEKPVEDKATATVPKKRVRKCRIQAVMDTFFHYLAQLPATRIIVPFYNNVFKHFFIYFSLVI